jgi:hypothetical protein
MLQHINVADISTAFNLFLHEVGHTDFAPAVGVLVFFSSFCLLSENG